MSNPKKLLILTYHRIGRDDDFVSRGMGGPGVSVEDFAAQMRFLSRHSRLVTLAEALRRMTDSTGPDESLRVITFDDGYRDNYTRAWPILQQYNIPVTIFLVAGHVGSQRLIWQHRLYYIKDIKGEAWLLAFLRGHGLCRWQENDFSNVLKWFKAQGDLKSRDALLDRMWAQAGLDSKREEELARKLYLQWPEVLEMSKAGVEFGSHSISHPCLSSLHGEALRYEVAGSKEILERRLGKRIDCFCYPYGDEKAVNEEVVEQVRGAQYKGAPTTVWGVNAGGASWDSFRLRRKAVSYSRPLDMWLEFSGIKDLVRKWAGVTLALFLLAGCSPSVLDEADKKIKALRIELQSDPGDMADHYQLGVLLHAKGEHGEAAGHLAEGAKDPKFAISAQFEMAMIDYERGRYDDALATLEKIKQNQQGFPFPEIYYHMGRIHLRENRTQAAVDSFKKSIDLGYSQKAAYFLLGDTLFRTGNFTEAAEFLRKYMDVDPQMPIVRLYLGKALDSLGKKEEAKKEFRTIKENAPWLRQANLVVLENYRFHEGDEWVVRGVLKNMSIIKLLDVRAQASLLDSQGKVLNEQAGLVWPPNLYPSQEGSFEFRFPFEARAKTHEIKGSGRIPDESLQDDSDWLDRVS